MPRNLRIGILLLTSLAPLWLALAAGPAAAQQQPPQPQPQQPQGRPGGQPEWLRQAAQLDLTGHGAEARARLEVVADKATDPAVQAAAWRAIALSYAFDGNCADAGKYEQKVIDYWKTRERSEPQNAFYQEGEVADEAGRICIDAGDLPAAQRWYMTGFELGTKEPEPRTHPRSLWEYRLDHALARIAARRGDAREAAREVAAARHVLDSDSAMAAQQERFFPYLTGYVALYTGDPARAAEDLARALTLRGNERDPFLHTLLGMAYEKLGRTNDALTEFRRAGELATAHNPPSAYTVRFLRLRQGDSPPPGDGATGATGAAGAAGLAMR